MANQVDAAKVGEYLVEASAFDGMIQSAKVGHYLVEGPDNDGAVRAAKVAVYIVEDNAPDTGVSYPLALVNPGFETGDTSGWTMFTGSSFAILAGGYDGSAYYANAGNQRLTRFGQFIDIPEERIADVDAGLIEAVGSFWHSCYSGDGDSGGFEMMFYSQPAATATEGDIIGLYGTPLKDVTNYPVWTLREGIGWVPPGTRSIKFSAKGWRDSGTENSTYYDDFALSLHTRSKPHKQVIYRRGTEAVDWVFTAGNPWTSGTQTNGWYGALDVLTAPSSSTVAAYFDRDLTDLPAEAQTNIHAGRALAELTAFLWSFDSSGDNPRVYVEALDINDESLGVFVQSASTTIDPGADGMHISALGYIPAGTVKLRFHQDGTRTGGSALDGYVNFVSLQIEVAGIGGVVDPGGSGRRRNIAMMIG